MVDATTTGCDYNGAMDGATARKSKIFEPLWRLWERRSELTGPRHTIYSVRIDPRHERQKKEAAIGAKVVGKYTTGSTYNGEWLKNEKHGFGCQVWSNGNKYQGDWRWGKRNGTGTLWVMKNKKLQKQYTGGWKDNKRHGYGVYYAKDGSKYEGEWEEGYRQGGGTLRYPNGDIYKGQFAKDLRSGFGTLHYVNGDEYQGEWVAGYKEGSGRYLYYSTNRVYVGEWVKDIPKCGVYQDIPQSVHAFCRNSKAAGFPLQPTGLEDAEQVFSDALTQTRREKQMQLGMLEAFAVEGEVTDTEAGLLEEEQCKSHNAVFSAEELGELKEAFNAVDKKGSGSIQGGQLVLVLNELGIFPAEEDVLELLEELGAHKDSQISLYEFVGLLATLKA